MRGLTRLQHSSLEYQVGMDSFIKPRPVVAEAAVIRDHWSRLYDCSRTTVFVLFIAICAIVQHSPAQAAPKVLPIKNNALALLDQPDSWFSSEEGLKKIDSIIAAQLPSGGWQKGYDPVQYENAAPPSGEWLNRGTIDNAFTYTEVRLLARAYNLTHRQAVLDSFDRALDFLLAMQYPTGGWPQRFPLPDDYGRLITFNDDAMADVMNLMRDVRSRQRFCLRRFRSPHQSRRSIRQRRGLHRQIADRCTRQADRLGPAARSRDASARQNCAATSCRASAAGKVSASFAC